MNTKIKIGIGLTDLKGSEYSNIREDKNNDKTEKAFIENVFSVLDFVYAKEIRYFGQWFSKSMM